MDDDREQLVALLTGEGMLVDEILDDGATTIYNVSSPTTPDATYLYTLTVTRTPGH